MGRRPHSEQTVEQTRQRLLQTAMALYLERGLGGVSLRQVAERGGLSHTLVYRYFADKDALLAELRLDCLAQFQSVLDKASDVPHAPLQRLRAVLMSALEFGRDRPAEYSLVFAHSQPELALFPALRAKRCEVFVDCVALVELALAERGPDGDALLITHGLWSLVHGMLLLHTADQLVHGLTLQHMAAPLLDAALRQLDAPVPA